MGGFFLNCPEHIIESLAFFRNRWFQCHWFKGHRPAVRLRQMEGRGLSPSAVRLRNSEKTAVISPVRSFTPNLALSRTIWLRTVWGEIPMVRAMEDSVSWAKIALE